MEHELYLNYINGTDEEKAQLRANYGTDDDVMFFDSLNRSKDVLRKSEYPSWEEQLDNIYHNGVDVWKADIQLIKDKYPKVETN